MTSGGSSRTTVSAVRLTMTPRDSAAGTTGAASRVSSSPQIRPAPRTSLTIGCAGGHRLEPLFDVTPDPADVREQSAVDQLVEHAERRAARQQVAAVGAAVIAERDRRRATSSLTSAAPIGTPPPSALPTDMRCGFRPMRREVERIAGAAEAALHFVGDQQRAGAVARLA